MTTNTNNIENVSQIPTLIAHRGYQHKYPENTLLSMQQAIGVGAQYIELDIQFTADGEAVLYHDRDLQRLSAQAGAVADLTLAQAITVPVFEPGRFDERFKSQTITPLSDIVDLLQLNPLINCFVEIKRASLETHEPDYMLDYLAKTLQPVIEQCVLMSFSFDTIVLARARGWGKVGVVLVEWQQVREDALLELDPQFVFCDIEKLPEHGSIKLPVGQLAIYEVQDPKTALALYQRGAEFIETFKIEEMLDGLQALVGSREEKS